MWLLAHTRGQERDTALQRAAVLQLNNDISAAALHARRGEYEEARRFASEFFSRLRSEVDSGDALNPRERESVRALLQQRDEMITLLARSDPATVDRLFNIEHQLRQLLRIHS
jgi:hypothetical protein